MGGVGFFFFNYSGVSLLPRRVERNPGVLRENAEPPRMSIVTLSGVPKTTGGVIVCRSAICHKKGSLKVSFFIHAAAKILPSCTCNKGHLLRH